ncbi:MAG: hypothetical protein OEL83_05165 [Desulforhopalus sp.]|nr:hypothetical protein [Desulforhopalus sp.]
MTNKDKDMAELIPDYCNNRLDAQGKADFERRLMEDPELLDEYNEFRGFQKLYRQIDPAEPSPSDAIFKKISGNIRTERKFAGKAPVEAGTVMELLGSFWQRLRQSIAVPWMLAAAQAVAIVLLLVPSPQDNTYRTLSATDMAATAGKAGINVVFQPNALESDIRNLLHGIRGSVRSGPSREGRYVVGISDPGDLDKTVQVLKQSNIVLFVEAVR